MVKRGYHWPRLDTILMVEEVLMNTGPEEFLTIAELKKRLPKKIQHNTLKIILQYLESNGKIEMDLRGITWLKPHERQRYKLWKY